MPEGPEVETDRLHEAIHEEMEKEEGGASAFLKQIALTTAILAAFAAVAALRAGATVNEALLLKTDATRLQALASDQWAYYQAKGIKSEVQATAGAAWLAAGKAAPPGYDAEAKRYKQEQKEITAKAGEYEHERDERVKESDHLLHEHHRYANAVALFQVSIALGAVAALTRSRPVWLGSMLVGAGGIALFALALAG
jgi:hypothetical protein